MMDFCSKTIGLTSQTLRESHDQIYTVLLFITGLKNSLAIKTIKKQKNIAVLKGTHGALIILCPNLNQSLISKFVETNPLILYNRRSTKIFEVAFSSSFVNPLQPKVLGVKFSLREIGRIFFTNIPNFKLFKMPNL